jgi:PPOX class probable F420-dependent enzyme
MPKIEGRARELMTSQNFCTVAALRDDGSPYLVVLWVDTDGEHVLLNSEEGFKWVDMLRADPRVTVVTTNAENQYEYVRVSGEAVAFDHDGADAHIDALSKRYLDKDDYPWREEGQFRYIIRVRPDKVFHKAVA